MALEVVCVALDPRIKSEDDTRLFLGGACYFSIYEGLGLCARHSPTTGADKTKAGRYSRLLMRSGVDRPRI